MCERFLTPEDLISGNVFVLQPKVVRNTLVIRQRFRSTFILAVVSRITRSKMLRFTMSNVDIKVQIGISFQWDVREVCCKPWSSQSIRYNRLVGSWFVPSAYHTEVFIRLRGCTRPTWLHKEIIKGMVVRRLGDRRWIYVSEVLICLIVGNKE